MATMAQPIRGLSARVQFEVATVQKDFWEVCDARDARSHARTHERSQAIRLKRAVESKTLALNQRMSELIKGQQAFIAQLHSLPIERLEPMQVDKIASDIERLVGLTDSMVDDAYHMPQTILHIWRANLVRIADLNRHLDSFAESFRIAADNTCSALLADISRSIMVGDAVLV